MEKKIFSKQKIDLVGPHFSIIIPFSPVMVNSKLLFNLLKTAVDKAEREIKVKYTIEESLPLVKGLRELIKDVKDIPKEKTLAMFVSSFEQNIYYFTATKKLYVPPVLVHKPI